MKKSIIGIVAIVIIAVIIIGAVFIFSKNKEEKPNTHSAVKIQTAEEMEKNERIQQQANHLISTSLH